MRSTGGAPKIICKFRKTGTVLQEERRNVGIDVLEVAAETIEVFFFLLQVGSFSLVTNASVQNSQIRCVEHLNTRADGVEHADDLLSLRFRWLSEDENLAVRRMDSKAEFDCFVDDCTQVHKNNVVFISYMFIVLAPEVQFR